MKTRAWVVAVSLFATGASFASAEERKVHPKRSEEIDGEAGLIRERVRFYLDRHGDQGRIDPERRLKAVAREYVRHRLERLQPRPASAGRQDGAWVSLGPTNGAGRMTAITPHPVTAGTFYAGAAGGGVWKTTDAGVSWSALTESINDLSVGAVAIAPSSPNLVYVGTGEGGYARDFIPGIGMLTSTDGGETWSFPSTVAATTFYRILVHPSNPLELVAGTNRGALRTLDGGGSWTTVLDRANFGDVTDIVRHPTDPATLYAATWCVANCISRVARIVKSTDGGATWTEKSAGLPGPEPPRSATYRFNQRLSLAISESNPLVLYAATGITSDTGSVVSHVYKTTDGGESWTDLPSVFESSTSQVSRYLGEQSWYDNVIVVSPADPNVVLAGGVTYIRSTDGGATFSRAPMTGVHVDAHDLRYQGSTLLIANDGGIWTSPDNGATAVPRNAGLVTRQYYALATDSINRNRMIAGSQDNGTNQREDPGGTTWRPVIGGDGFQCAINPLAPSVAYGTVQFGIVFRSKDVGAAGNAGFSLILPPYGQTETTPFFSLFKLDPSNPGIIYTGSYRLWRSESGGDSWRPLSTSTSDGSIWATETILTAIAIAPSDPEVLMVAKTNVVFRSTDGGRSWVNSASPSNARVNFLEIDPVNPRVAYAAIATTSGTSLYRTTDGATTWAPRASGLPTFAAQVVRVDPKDPNVLYCGTDVGVFRSTDQGATWSRFGTGLPSASVYDVQVLADGSLLRVATHGRGVWELEMEASGNTPPVVAIVQPPAALTVSKGETVNFSASLSDPGDTVAGHWFFTDTWDGIAAGDASVAHTFTRSGIFPVGLTARDGSGAEGGATLKVTVLEPWDACETPYRFPGAGPFPFTILTDTEAATSQPTDPGPSCVTNRTASLWFEFTPEAAGTYEFSTCGATWDTVLSVHTGGACGAYTPVFGGCNDDAETICAGSVSSVVTVTANAGEPLRVLLTGFVPPERGRVPVTVRRLTVDDAAPRVTGISRIVGPSAGGTVLHLSGANFQSGANVRIGGEPAGGVTRINGTLLELTTPPHQPGPVDVVVSNPDGGSGTMSGGFSYLGGAPIAPCAPGPATLCLNGGRFQVSVHWRAIHVGTSGVGTAVGLTADTGYFWFFSSANVELVVKVLDGRAFNERFWVFYGALSDVEYTITVIDTATGAVRSYFNPQGRLASVADTAAFAGGPPGAASPLASHALPPASGIRRGTSEACAPGATALCLNEGRFQVRVDWRAPSLAQAGPGQAVPLSADTGYFWFFSSQNVELVVKVLDGRGVNGRFWVFFGALSNVEYTVTVTDSQTGAVRTYVNPPGTLASIADTSAF